MNAVFVNAAMESLRTLREGARERLHEGEAAWIGRLRDNAFATFETLGIPTRRLADWKSTNLASLEGLRFERIATPEQNPIVVTGDGGPRLRFLDGRLESANSSADRLPKGVRLLSLSEARRQAPELLEGRLAELACPKRHAMVALQTAFLDDGAVLVIDSGVDVDAEVEAPIRLSFETLGDAESQPSAAFPRLLVVAGENSRATISIENRSAAAGLTILVSEFFLAQGAQIESVQVQEESAGRFHFSNTHARLDRNARFDSHVVSLSSGLVRSELEIELAEPSAETRMRGFYLGCGSGHVDHFTTVDHAAPSCTSDEEYRGVLGGESAGVFRGRVIVRPDAQKTDARQSNPNLLVSERASIDSKPQLEIYADDVRASHGSTTGQLDRDAIFFLRARGIDEREARLLLTRAFAQTIIDDIRSDVLRSAIAERIDVALAFLEEDVKSEPARDEAPAGDASL